MRRDKRDEKRGGREARGRSIGRWRREARPWGAGQRVARTTGSGVHGSELQGNGVDGGGRQRRALSAVGCRAMECGQRGAMLTFELTSSRTCSCWSTNKRCAVAMDRNFPSDVRFAKRRLPFGILRLASS